MSPETLIEVSFEVANKVGGIHQVLKSKAEKMDEYNENYITVGYYDEEKAQDEFAPRSEPEFMEPVEELEEEGIEVKFGVWRVSCQPLCILVDPSGMEKSVDEIKKEMYGEHGVDSIDAGEDFDEPVKWSYAVGKVIEKLEEELEGEKVVHLHEWLSGPAMMNFESSSVFTTHATVLGRTLSNSSVDLQGAIEEGEVEDSLADEYGVKAKHQVEKMAAQQSDVFVTVSELMQDEAEAVLDRKPDIITPNGFNVEDFPSLEELSYLHKKKKTEVKEFLRAYFEPYYDIDLEHDPRILFISGRYEVHNKGVDLLIDALSDINEKEGEEFFVFFFVPTETEGVKSEVLENMSLYQELEDYIDSMMPRMRKRMLNSLTSLENPGEGVKELLEDTSQDWKSFRDLFHDRKKKRPPKTPFELTYLKDDILDMMYRRGLENRKGDRVKVVFYPTYLSKGDKLLSMDYQEAIKASSAGIFPSYYEPWGYTPVETAANGALSITTDMAGFGQFLVEETEEQERKGIRVLERKDRDYEDVKKDLAGMIEDIIGYSKTEITERKHNARKLAQLTSWDRLGEKYREAHEKAVDESN
jgi:glycogen(starch) synthase